MSRASSTSPPSGTPSRRSAAVPRRSTRSSCRPRHRPLGRRRRLRPKRALQVNTALEYERNAERYRFLRWGQQAFSNFRVVPPGTGICHQVNLEYLSRVVFTDERRRHAYPDTRRRHRLAHADGERPRRAGVGSRWHRGRGGHARPADLDARAPGRRPSPHGELPEGTTATDLVLTVAELLRRHGVVGKFVECYGPGVAASAREPGHDRQHVAGVRLDGDDLPDRQRNSPLSPPHRPPRGAVRARRGVREDPGAVARAESADPAYSERIELDLSTVEPSIAGPSRRRTACRCAGRRRCSLRPSAARSRKPIRRPRRATATRSPLGDDRAPRRRRRVRLEHGHVVIAAITSCTNTSNPQVMIGAGLVAKKAVELGLAVQALGEDSLAPGSRVVMDYLGRAGSMPYLEKLGFDFVGFGCTTCIGNSGPLPRDLRSHQRQRASRAWPCSRATATSRAGSTPSPDGLPRVAPARRRLRRSPARWTSTSDRAARLRRRTASRSCLPTSGPPAARSPRCSSTPSGPTMFRREYAEATTGDERWRSFEVPTGQRYAWEESRLMSQRPPFFEGMQAEPEPITDVTGARVLAVLGDSVTTDHISPAGSIRPTSPAGDLAHEHGVTVADFNSYGARRGNHEVMIRGTFANTRIRNHLVPGPRAGVTVHLPDGEPATIFEAAARYQSERRPSRRHRRQGVRLGLLTGLGGERARSCSASARSSPRASSGSTGRT